jgi:hypothetical protein
MRPSLTDFLLHGQCTPADSAKRVDPSRSQIATFGLLPSDNETPKMKLAILSCGPSSYSKRRFDE